MSSLNSEFAIVAEAFPSQIMAEEDVKLFMSIGLDEENALGNAKKKKNCQVLKEVIKELDLKEALPRNTALMLQAFAVKCPESAGANRPLASRSFFCFIPLILLSEINISSMVAH